MKDHATALFLRFQRSGDGHAMGQLFDMVGSELLAVARHVAPDVAAAEDLVQTTFLLAIERAGTFDKTRGVKPWMYGILVREAAKARRSAAREPDPARLGGHSGGHTKERAPLEVAVGAEAAALVHECIGKLPDHYREVLEPHLVRGLSAPEIALLARRETGSGPSSAHVRVQIARGLAKLREMLPRGLSLGVLGTVAAPRGEAAIREVIVQASGSVALSSAPAAVPLVIAPHVLLGGALLSQGITALALGAIALTAGAAWWITSRPTDTARDIAAEARPVEANAEPSELLRPGVKEPARSEVAARLRKDPTQGAQAPNDTDGDAADEEVHWAGYVVDANGTAAPGALVEVRFEYDKHERLRIPVTGPDATFTLPKLSGGAFIAATRPGHAPARVIGLDSLDSGEPLRLKLRGPDARMRVDLRDEAGAPVAGAAITVHEDGFGGQFHKRGFVGLGWRHEAVSDENGLALIPGLYPAPHTVVVRAEDCEPTLTARRLMSPTLSAGEERRVELVLTRGAVLVGRVTEAGGAPMAGAVVRGEGGDRGISCRADDDGFYELRGLLPGQRAVTADSDDDRFKTASTAVTLDVDRTERWDPVLERSVGLTGHLVNHLGAALAEWHVSVHTRSPDVYRARTRTGSAGEFAFVAVPDEEYFIVARERMGYDDTGPLGVFTGLPRDGSDALLELTEHALAKATVTGRAVFPDGTPARSFRVVIESLAQGGSESKPVDPAGRFRFERILNGTYEISLTTGDHLSFRVARRSAELIRGDPVDLGNLIVERPGVVTLTPVMPISSSTQGVADASSTPTKPPGPFTWKVEREAKDDLTKEQVSIDGAFPQPTPLPPGHYVLTLEATHFRAAPIPFRVDAGEPLLLRVPLDVADQDGQGASTTDEVTAPR